MLPSVAARPSGDALVAWLDTRDDPTRRYHLVYGALFRGDASLRPNMRLTKCPSWGASGEYCSFDAWGGRPVLIFSAMRDVRRQSDVFLLEGLAG